MKLVNSLAEADVRVFDGSLYRFGQRVIDRMAFWEGDPDESSLEQETALLSAVVPHKRNDDIFVIFFEMGLWSRAGSS